MDGFEAEEIDDVDEDEEEPKIGHDAIQASVKPMLSIPNLPT